jgi:hypothetical protein
MHYCTQAIAVVEKRFVSASECLASEKRWKSVNNSKYPKYLVDARIYESSERHDTERDIQYHCTTVTSIGDIVLVGRRIVVIFRS